MREHELAASGLVCRLKKWVSCESLLRVPAGADTALEERQATVLPTSSFSTAIGYALRNWVALTRYTEDGRLKIDNNGAEQAMRPIVLGRRNWLFAGSEARHTALRSSVHSCRRVSTCRSDPFVYLRDVIERVATHPARCVVELTPREWKRLRQDVLAKAVP